MWLRYKLLNHIKKFLNLVTLIVLALVTLYVFNNCNSSTLCAITIFHMKGRQKGLNLYDFSYDIRHEHYEN